MGFYTTCPPPNHPPNTPTNLIAPRSLGDQSEQSVSGRTVEGISKFNY